MQTAPEQSPQSFSVSVSYADRPAAVPLFGRVSAALYSVKTKWAAPSQDRLAFLLLLLVIASLVYAIQQITTVPSPPHIR